MHTPGRNQAISELVSLAEAARRLKRNPHWVRGACDVLGIELTSGGNALLMTTDGFRRLREHDAKGRKKKDVTRRRTTAQPA